MAALAVQVPLFVLIAISRTSLNSTQPPINAIVKWDTLRMEPNAVLALRLCTDATLVHPTLSAQSVILWEDSFSAIHCAIVILESTWILRYTRRLVKSVRQSHIAWPVQTRHFVLLVTQFFIMHSCKEDVSACMDTISLLTYALIGSAQCPVMAVFVNVLGTARWMEYVLHCVETTLLWNSSRSVTMGTMSRTMAAAKTVESSQISNAIQSIIIQSVNIRGFLIFLSCHSIKILIPIAWYSLSK